MDLEKENKQEQPTGQNENGREGYSKPSAGYQQGEYRTVGKTPRPRIHVQRAYTTDRDNSNDEGGFRPEGFGAGLQSAGNGY